MTRLFLCWKKARSDGVILCVQTTAKHWLRRHRDGYRGVVGHRQRQPCGQHWRCCGGGRQGAAGTVWQSQCCRHSVAGTVLQAPCCRHSVAGTVLQAPCCRHRVAGTVLMKHFNTAEFRTYILTRDKPLIAQ